MSTATHLYVLLLVILLYIIVNVPTPYVIYTPGIAQSIKPMLYFDNGGKKEKGTFMLTTVSVRTGTAMQLLLAILFDKHAKIEKKETRLHGQTEEQYNAQQIWHMKMAQLSAVEAAYVYAHVNYNLVPRSILVRDVYKRNPSSGDICLGDEIVAIDSQRIKDHLSLVKHLNQKCSDSHVKVRLKRKGKWITRNLKRIQLEHQHQKKFGLGITVSMLYEVRCEHKNFQVQFKDTTVGGPSAGLMFTLQIYNQLIKEDLTKGYCIAGTGTVNREGVVGPIGGVAHKVVAAASENADFFFVPQQNYSEAQKKAETIRTTMKIIPVRTVQHALSYMKTFKPK